MTNKKQTKNQQSTSLCRVLLGLCFTWLKMTLFLPAEETNVSKQKTVSRKHPTPTLYTWVMGSIFHRNTQLLSLLQEQSVNHWAPTLAPTCRGHRPPQCAPAEGSPFTHLPLWAGILPCIFITARAEGRLSSTPERRLSPRL